MLFVFILDSAIHSRDMAAICTSCLTGCLHVAKHILMFIMTLLYTRSSIQTSSVCFARVDSFISQVNNKERCLNYSQTTETESNDTSLLLSAVALTEPHRWNQIT